MKCTALILVSSKAHHNFFFFFFCSQKMVLSELYGAYWICFLYIVRNRCAQVSFEFLFICIQIPAQRCCCYLPQFICAMHVYFSAERMWAHECGDFPDMYTNISGKVLPPTPVHMCCRCILQCMKLHAHISVKWFSQKKHTKKKTIDNSVCTTSCFTNRLQQKHSYNFLP